MRVDPLEDGFKSSSNLTKFHAAADRVFNLTANDLFDRDDLLQGVPEGAYRVICSIIALIMRVGGELLVAGRAVSRISHRKAHADSSTHPNSSYGTRSKVASLSTPNLSTLQHSVSPTNKVALHWSL